MTNTCSQCIYSYRIPEEENEPKEFRVFDPHECRYDPPNRPTVEEQFWGECPFIEGSRQPCCKFNPRNQCHDTNSEAFDIMGTNCCNDSSGVRPGLLDP